MVATMAKNKSVEEDKSTLNVAPQTRILLGKIAALRDKTMKQFFLEPDVVALFQQMYAEELKKEQAAMRGK